MSNEEDVLSKANALLSRYRTNENTRESPLPDFPVLTEIVQTASRSAPPDQTSGDIATESRGAFSAPSEDILNQELEQLAIDLRHKVLLAVETYVTDRLGELLENRARSHLAPAVDLLAKEIAQAAKHEVAQLLRTAADQEVQRELAILQARIKGASD